MNFYIKSLCRRRAGMAKILLVMRLIIVVLTTAILQVSASSYGQRVTLMEKNASLELVLKKIKQQTGYDVLYKDNALVGAKRVSIKLNDVALEQALDKILEDQALSFEIDEKTILIKKKEPSFLDRVVGAVAVIDVIGKVVDEKGVALIGATVSVKNGRITTTTDKDGGFVLTKIDDKAVLAISFIGYLTKEVNANGDLSEIVLKLSDSKLDEVQIIAYGTTSQRLNTGNVATVKSSDIEKQPVQNPLLALQGRVPGLIITQQTGLSGSGVNVQIQGQNSIQYGNDPFYVIDGVPFVSQLLPNYGSMLGTSAPSGLPGGQSGNPLSFINPSDIESISVLKDADATAIYGSRAANGAILITTKKGKEGQLKASFDVQSGIGEVAKKVHLLNTQQYVEVRKEALKNDGINTPDITDYDIDGLWDINRNTDWQQQLIGGTAHYNNASATFSGGSENTQYLLGGTYHKESTVFPTDFANQKGSIHFNINNVSRNQKFRMQFSGSYQLDANKLPTTDLTSTAVSLPPNAPTLYNSDGGLNWMPDANGNSSWNNPLAFLLRKFTNKTNNLVSNALLSYKIIPGLDLKTSFGYTSLLSTQSLLNPLTASRPESRARLTRSAQYADNKINSWIVEPQISYQRTLGQGKLDFLLGASFQQNNSDGKLFRGRGYASDQVMADIKSATTLTVESSTAAIYKYNAFFGRINYNYSDKYIVNLTARRDGSSRFGPESQFHNFGAVGSAWIFSEEDFVKNGIPFLSFGKIRASYGTTGNDQIGDYTFINLYNTINPEIAYQGVNGISPSSLFNASLQWEETKKLQFGIDLGLLEDRILLSSGFYRNTSSNQLLSFSLPYITGFSGIASNFPAKVENSGFEFSLNTSNIKSSNFSWSTSVNITLPQNKLLSFQNLETTGYASSLVLGKPVSIKRVFHYNGVDTKTGIYQFIDSQGNLTSTPNDLTDRINTIDTDPVLYGGFQNSISYKDFQIDLLFQFVKQTAQNNFFGNFPGILLTNQPTTILNRWQNQGDVVTHQKFNSDFNLYESSSKAAQSDAAYQDASFIKLKNMSVSWKLPVSTIQKLKLTNARLFMQGQNLFTITNFQGFDPESLSFGSLPPLRVITIGVQVGL